MAISSAWNRYGAVELECDMKDCRQNSAKNYHLTLKFTCL
jgi:hypothetical protein